jgi:hypothetical protein
MKYTNTEGKKESVDRGCHDMSSVIGLLADGAEMKGNGAIADGELRTLVARFPRRLHYCTNAGITLKKSHFVPLFGTSGVPSTRDVSLHNPFDREQIGTEMSPARRSENLVGQGTPGVPHQLLLIVHYLSIEC